MKSIPVGGRVKYKSLASEKVYYATVKSINEHFALVVDDQGERQIRVDRLQFIPYVFAGKAR